MKRQDHSQSHTTQNLSNVTVRTSNLANCETELPCLVSVTSRGHRKSDRVAALKYVALDFILRKEDEPPVPRSCCTSLKHDEMRVFLLIF
jgi:hypothetical protein